MKRGFIPGAIVGPSSTPYGMLSGRAEILRYDGEGFYIVKTARSSALVVHEDDIELVMHADCDNRGGACNACRSS